MQAPTDFKIIWSKYMSNGNIKIIEKQLIKLAELGNLDAMREYWLHIDELSEQSEKISKLTNCLEEKNTTLTFKEELVVLAHNYCNTLPIRSKILNRFELLKQVGNLKFNQQTYKNKKEFNEQRKKLLNAAYQQYNLKKQIYLKTKFIINLKTLINNYEQQLLSGENMQNVALMLDIINLANNIKSDPIIDEKPFINAFRQQLKPALVKYRFSKNENVYDYTLAYGILQGYIQADTLTILKAYKTFDSYANYKPSNALTTINTDENIKS